MTEKHGAKISCPPDISFSTSKFGSSYKSTRISEAVVRRSIVDHPPGPVRLPDYKCRFLGPLRLKFSPRWPGVEYIIAARENNPKSPLHAAARPQCPALEDTRQSLSVRPLQSPTDQGRSRSDDLEKTSRQRWPSRSPRSTIRLISCPLAG